MAEELRELVLHVDLNKTIVMLDPGDYQYKVEDVFADIVCK